jgi:transketolase
VRNTFANVFYEEAKKDARLCVVVADISPAGSMEKLRKEYPKRFVNTGVAEQIMIATFALFRPYEFVRDDLCYQGLPVTVVGVGGGVTYSTLGGTHHAMEDVAIACAMPGMSVIAPCDPEETRAATLHCVTQQDGPIYLRLGKAGEPVLGSATSAPFRFGKLRMLREGSDACILGYGPILKMAMQAAEGKSIAVASVHTLKPLDREGIARLLAKYPKVVVLEEMVPQGGLGDAVKVLAWESGAKCRIECLSLKHEFVHTYGSHEQLLAAHGISVQEIVRRLGNA